MVKIQFFSEGKTKNRNEDYFNYNKSCFCIADGATDKSGKIYNGKTGGELVSHIIVTECLKTNFNGVKLVKHLNDKINHSYHKLNILDKIQDPKYRFTSGFICVRLVNNKIKITYLGDLGFRINGNEFYQEKNQIDINNAEERSRYIMTTNDIKGSRDHIMPLLLKQFEYQNNPKKNQGYGAIDGTKTPSKFVKTFEYNLSNVKIIELFTDGYFNVPKNALIEDWEKIFQKIEKDDPDKWKKYKSTKFKDDRTIAIIKF